MIEYTFLVPVGFDLAMLVQSYPPKISPFKPEKVLYIIDVITQIPARNHDAGDDEDGFVPVNADVLRDVIGNKYLHYLKWLVDCVTMMNHLVRPCHRRSQCLSALALWYLRLCT